MAKKKKKQDTTGKKVAAIITLVVILVLAIRYALVSSGDMAYYAIINGQGLSQDEIDARYSQLPEQYQLFMDRVEFSEQLVNVRLLVQEAVTLGVEATDAEVEKGIADLRGVTEDFEERLQAQGMTLVELREQLWEEITINKLLNSTVLSDITVDERSIRSYYDENIELFSARDGQIRLKHILVETENEAKKVLSDLGSGTDFSALARRISIDTVSAERGGDLGFVRKGQMIPVFEDAAFALRQGALSAIVETQHGFHVILRESDQIRFEEVYDQIHDVLEQELSSSAVETFVTQLKGNAEITYPGVEMTFIDTGDDICTSDEGVIVRMFSKSDNEAAVLTRDGFNSLSGADVKEVMLDKKVSRSDLELFKKYNPKSTIPTYVFGCKYVRIGNAYEDSQSETEEFKRVLEKLV